MQHTSPHHSPPARTPYHELSQTAAPTVPGWAKRRSVYRASGRTLYVVETDRLAQAQPDLARLRGLGWQVDITATGDHSAAVSLSRRDFARAA